MENHERTTDMRILLTGKNGQLGWELHRQLERDFNVLAIGREDVDFLDTKFFTHAIGSLPKINLIVNAAAYTDIDKASQEPFVTEAVNSEAVATLAAEADRRGIPMIHFSTSHVFSGQRRTRPYREADRPNPASLYSSTKLEGECRLRNILEKHLVFRLSGLYDSHHKNFFTEILTRNRKGIASRVADNQIISPNWTPLVAEAVVEVIQQLLWGNEIPWGIYHLSGGGSTTPYGFAQLICEKINEVWGGNMPLPIPIRSQRYRDTAFSNRAKRPKYSVLDSTRFKTVFHHTLPDWQEQFLRFFGGIDPRTPILGKPILGKPIPGKPVPGKPALGKPVPGKDTVSKVRQ